MGALGSGPDATGAGQVVGGTVKGEFWEEVTFETRRLHKQSRTVPSRGQKSEAVPYHLTAASPSVKGGQ